MLSGSGSWERSRKVVIGGVVVAGAGEHAKPIYEELTSEIAQQMMERSSWTGTASSGPCLNANAQRSGFSDSALQVQVGESSCHSIH